ncbi:MAG: type II secretion system protein GspG [Candidatus Sumerlaeaceae bacterium]|nr:type II secretion system protein GspG [Candidatus Sumerlaeaceae bacterium]
MTKHNGAAILAVTPQTQIPPAGCNRDHRAFTLVELLIVVAIIAILAAIAMPNYLEAQTRSKVSRTKADMRSLAAAIEAYRVDTNHYPPPYGVAVGGRDSLSILSTPLAYITSGKLLDPFASQNPAINRVALTYEAMNAFNQIIESPALPPYSVAPSDPTAQPTMWWWVASRGPNQRYDGFGVAPNPSIQQAIYEADLNPGAWLGMVYDATNGTVSRGNIYRAGGAVAGFAGRSMMR